MRALVFFLIACGAPADAPEPSVAAPAPTEAPTPPEAPPAGRIGGAPILPNPVVVGAIEASEVTGVIQTHLPALDACYTSEVAKNPELAGKVLVKFSIQQDGTVKNARTESTSLRHEPTESCLADVVSTATFPALERGKLAVVQFPFTFPRT
jgi:hypothetical protein